MTLEFEAEHTLGPFAYNAQFCSASELLVLFGHSGAGKSLTLQFISGLLRPRNGRITVAGQVVFDSQARLNLPPQRRRTGYVVQELALFEHLTVAENVAFGIPPHSDRPRRIRDLLDLLELGEFSARSPRTLSGGQRQRVALARALAREAPLLLLDEPFSALDDNLRHAMRRELLRLRSELDLTIVFVTHDLREAHFLADRIAVFDAGQLLQIGPRTDVFHHPSSRRVAELSGVANIWSGKVRDAGPDFTIVEVEAALLRAGPVPTRFAPGQSVDVMVRAERINLRRDAQPGSGAPNVLRARVTAEFAYGASHTLHLDPEPAGPRLEVEIAARPYEVLGVASRKVFDVQIDPADIHIVPADRPN